VIIEKIEALGDKPRPDSVQDILDQIAAEKTEKLRSVLFATAQQNLKGKGLKDLATKAESRATKEWKARKMKPDPSISTRFGPAASGAALSARLRRRRPD